MGTLVESLMTKLGFAGDHSLLRKTNELLRLLELRSGSNSLQINEYGKIVICIDLACNLLGLICDKEDAVKLSCLRKSAYSNQKRTIEKMLDVGKVLDINDICIQLNLNEVKKKAEEILKDYEEALLSRNMEIDRKLPQYVAMAVFLAAKFHKKKISKPKMMSYSNLKPTQWQQLEQSWEQTMLIHQQQQQQQQERQQQQQKTIKSKIIGDGEVISENEGIKLLKRTRNNRKEIVQEDYFIWKERMLSEAKQKLLKIEQITNNF